MHDLLSPLKAVVLVNESYRRIDGALSTTCPRCESRMWIIGKSFVCDSTSCTFSRGSALDFMAEHVGSYQEALKLASDDVPYYRDRIEQEAGECALRRKLLDFAIDVESQNFVTDIERVRLRQAFASYHKLPTSAFERGHWFLTSKQSDTLVLLLCMLGLTPPPILQGRPNAIAPYWGNLHTLGVLYILNAGLKDFKLCPVFPFRASWFGLQSLHPTTNKVKVYSNYQTAMARIKIDSTMDHEWFPTSLHVNARAGIHGHAFGELRFQGTLEEMIVQFPRWCMVDGFESATFFCEGLELTLTELLDHMVAVKQGEFKEITDMLAGMKLSPQVRAHLLHRADRIPNSVHATSMRNVLQRKLLARDDKGAIYECPDGYFVENDQKLLQATTFTLEFERMVCFSALQEARYVGRAFIGPYAVKFDMTGQKLENPSALEETLRSLHTLDTRELGTGLNATVCRPKEFRRVLEALRVKRSELPRFIGVNNLGWNHRFDTFFFPNLIIDRTGIHGNVTYHPDEAGEHHCYHDKAPLPNAVSEIAPAISPPLAELISALLAQTLRLYHAKNTRLWPVLNNEGRENALRLFEGFGQTAVMRLTQFTTRNFDLNRGMPCLMTLLNELQAGKVRMAGAYLTDHGLDMSKFSPAEIQTAAHILPSLLAEVVRRLIAGEQVSYKERRSVDPLAAIAEEGASLIRKDFWDSWPQAGSRWATIDKLLEVKEDVIPRLVTIDCQANTLLFPSALWEDLDLDPVNLQIELGLLNLNTEMKDNGLRVDRTTMNRVFTEFYGKVPELLAV